MKNYVVHRKNEWFIKVPMDVINDDDLSLEAKGMLVWMLSRPDDWEFSLAGMMSVLNKGRHRNGRDSINSAMKQLEVVGYLRIQKGIRIGGRFASVYHVYDHRITAAEDRDLLALSQDVDHKQDCVEDESEKTDGSVGFIALGDSEDLADPNTKTGQKEIAPQKEEAYHRCGFPAPVNQQQQYIREDRLKDKQSPTKPKRNRISAEVGIAACPIIESEPDSQGMDGVGLVELNDDEAQVLDELVTLSINRNFSSGRILERENLKARLDEGYTLDQIKNGFEAYKERYKERHPSTPRFALRLCEWLSKRGDGMLFDCRKPVNKSVASTSSLSQQQNMDEISPYEQLAEKDEVFKSLLKEQTSLNADLARIAIMRTKNDEEAVRKKESKLELEALIEKKTQEISSYFASRQIAMDIL
jgi:hypothetical protein